MLVERRLGRYKWILSFYLNLFERVTESKRDLLSASYSADGLNRQNWAKLKSRSRSFIQVSPRQGRQCPCHGLFLPGHKQEASAHLAELSLSMPICPLMQADGKGSRSMPTYFGLIWCSRQWKSILWSLGRERERERVRLSIASLVSLEREVVTWNQLQGPGEWQYILGKEPFDWQVGR